MKRITLAVFVVACLGVTPSVGLAQFGGLKLPGTPSSNSAPAGDIDAFLKTAADAEGLVRKSSDVLFQAVATKDQIAQHDAQVQAANAIADPKEKEAALKKAADDEQAQLAKVDYAASAKTMSANLDAKKKAQVGSAIWNFMLGMMKDKELIDQGQGIIASVSSNPMAATKVVKAKDVVSSISSQMGNITKIAAGLQKLASVVGIDKLPSKSSEAPVAAAD